MNLVERVTDEVCRRVFLEVEASGRHVHLTEEQGAYFLEEEELLTIDRNLVPYAGEEE